MDTAITQDTALAEIIELVIGNQTEFTKDGVKALVKTIFQIYKQEYLNDNKKDVILPEAELLSQYGIEIINTKFSKTQIDKSQLEFLISYLPKLPEGQFARVKNPKGIYKLREELLNHLGEETYKITIVYSGEENNKTKTLNIYKNKKNIA
jgi:hypothetical protein